MAEWELSPAFMKVRKKLGNMVFYAKNGEILARKLPAKREQNSQAQDEITAAFTQVGYDWKYLAGVIQNSWDEAAKSKKGIGYTCFVGANITLQREGNALDLSRSLGQLPLSGFKAQTGSAAGEIVCEFAWGTANAGKHVTFFIQKRENNLATGDIVRVDGGADPVSPYTLSGLEPGVEYFAYAVVTEKAYAEATTVSIARSAICTAGV